MKRGTFKMTASVIYKKYLNYEDESANVLFLSDKLLSHLDSNGLQFGEASWAFNATNKEQENQEKKLEENSVNLESLSQIQDKEQQNKTNKEMKHQ